jgi:uncharacterized membrane protein
MQTKRYVGYALAVIGFALILLGVREVADSQLAHVQFHPVKRMISEVGGAMPFVDSQTLNG